MIHLRNVIAMVVKSSFRHFVSSIVSGLLLLYLFSDCVKTDQPSPFLPPDFVPSLTYRSDSYDTLNKFISLYKSMGAIPITTKSEWCFKHTYPLVTVILMWWRIQFLEILKNSLQAQLVNPWKEGYSLLVNQTVDVLQNLCLINGIANALSWLDTTAMNLGMERYSLAAQNAASSSSSTFEFRTYLA